MTRYRFDRTLNELVPVDRVLAETGEEARSDLYREPKPLGDGRWRLIDGEWVPIGGDNGLPETVETQGVQIVKDIEPYRSVAVDKETGERPVLSGRRQHREFLKNNGYIEIGNDFIPNRREEVSTQTERVAAIKRAMNTL